MMRRPTSGGQNAKKYDARSFDSRKAAIEVWLPGICPPLTMEWRNAAEEATREICNLRDCLPSEDTFLPPHSFDEKVD